MPSRFELWHGGDGPLPGLHNAGVCHKVFLKSENQSGVHRCSGAWRAPENWRCKGVLLL